MAGLMANSAAAMKSVYPSRAALAANSDAITWPAPARMSIPKRCWFLASLSFGATNLATISLPPLPANLGVAEGLGERGVKLSHYRPGNPCRSENADPLRTFEPDHGPGDRRHFRQHCQPGGGSDRQRPQPAAANEAQNLGRIGEHE